MSPALKQRLVGAIVLVALAVIFVPMLLDGSGQQTGKRVSVDIPDEPEAPDPEFEQDASAGGMANAESAAATDATGDTPSQDPAQQQGQGTTAGAEAQDSGSDGASQGSSDLATESQDGDSDAASQASDAGETEPSDTPNSAGAGPSAWVVQVGSFERKTNAIVLRDKLREAEHDAFIEQGATEAGSVWRVRVGPVATRERVEALQQTLEAELELDSLVMSYPD